MDGGSVGVCQVPDWSGKFWEQDEFGFIQVHGDDVRTHRPPDPSWRFVRAYVSFEDDAHVFLYRKVSSDCPCKHASEGLNV